MNNEDQRVAEWMKSLDAKPHEHGNFIIEGDDHNSDQLITKWLATFFYKAQQANTRRILDKVEDIGIFTKPLDELAEFLTNMQASVCGYGTRDGDGRACDCKFGYTPRSKFLPSKGGLEQNGCPELCQAARTITALARIRNEELGIESNKEA